MANTQWFAYPKNDQINEILTSNLRETGYDISTCRVRDNKGNIFTVVSIPANFVNLILKHSILNRSCLIFYRNTNYGKVYLWAPQKKISKKARKIKEVLEEIKKSEKSA